ncbi:hypothetical protein [Alicyclobacillus fastidiosus]
MERWYNRGLIHSSIGYKIPVQFQSAYQQTLLKAAV